MNINSGRVLVSMLAAVAAIGVSDVCGQGIGAVQPPGGMLRPASDPNSPQRLEVAVTSTGGYDSNSAPDQTAIGVVDQDPPGYSTMLESAAEYSFQGRRLRLKATGTSAQRYFDSTNTRIRPYFRNVSQTGAVGFSLRSPRTLVAVNQTAVHSSSPLYTLFAQPPAGAGEPAIVLADAPSAAPNITVNEFDTHAYTTGVMWTRGFTPRTEVSGGGDWSRTDTLSAGAARRELTTYAVRAQISRRIARDTVATAGYLYRVGDIKDSAALIPAWRLPQQGIEGGIDYRRSLSPTKAIAIGTRFGASSIVLPQFAGASGGSNSRFNPLSGTVNVAYEFHRTWHVRGGYRRDLDYTPGVNEPLTMQTINTGIDGLISRRVDVVAWAGYSTAQSTMTWGKQAVESITGNARLRYALTRTLATYVEYVHYFYDAGESALLGSGLPTRLDRKGVRAGLALRVAAF